MTPAAAWGTDTDDGVTRNYSDSWNDGQGEIYVTVTGPAGQYACLNAWLDYSDGVTVPGTPDTPNGAFDGNEHVVDNLSMQAGANQLCHVPAAGWRHERRVGLQYAGPPGA